MILRRASSRIALVHDDGKAKTPVRVAVLWQGISGYLIACLGALQAHGEQVSVLLAYEKASAAAPYDIDIPLPRERVHSWVREPNEHHIMALIAEFKPDVLLVSSWHIRAYRQVLRRANRTQTLRILCMDNQWQGTAKQWAGRLASKAYLAPLYDKVFVPGERQADFARKLGFETSQIIRGLYAADTQAFHPASVTRAREFLYVGRLSPEKGIADLAAAYKLYCSWTSDPWRLRVAGVGQEAFRLSGDRVTHEGFVQPTSLPEVMAGSSCLVLPSHFEPWGVVVHEATAAGLPVICSDAVGAGTHLVQDGYNGFITAAKDAVSLAYAMKRMSEQSGEQFALMSEASLSLSKQFSPERWANQIVAARKMWCQMGARR